MTEDAVSLRCPACSKGFKVRPYKPEKAYACPKCRGPLDKHDLTAAPTQPRPELLLLDNEPPPFPREIPVRLGKYLIDGEVARGGMGVVYKGRQEGLDRVVAIKMLLGALQGDVEMVRRFHREARAAARLRHPNIVAIHEVGDFEGKPFFTMDFIDGRAFDQVLGDGPPDFDRAAEVLRDVARAVHYGHEQGIIHRDLKPGNILIDREGKALVTDFGLAKDLGSKSMLSVTGEVMGTPAFMSPEQAEGRVHEMDRRTDVYSLGAILYRVLTGKPPFEGATMAATIYKIVHEYTIEPERINRRVPMDLSAICMRALEKDRGSRYATAEALAEDLDRHLKGEPVSARPISGWDRFKRKLRAQKRAVYAAGGVAAVAAVAIVALALLWKKSELDMVGESLKNPDLRLTALGGLLEGLDRFPDRERALEYARGEVARGRDEASRRIAYRSPRVELADAYAGHIDIENPEELRILLVKILAGLRHKGSVPAMLGLVRNARCKLRIEAIRFFRSVPDTRAFYDLGRLASDREVGPEVREALSGLYQNGVLSAFGTVGRGVGGVIAELGSAVGEANKLLEQVIDEGAPTRKDGVDVMIGHLKEGDPMTRMKAAWELGKSKDPRAGEPLLGAVTDADDGVARMAAHALGEVGAAPFKDRVVALLAAPRAGVRQSVAQLLVRIGDKALRPAVEAAYRTESDQDAKYAMEDALVALR